MNSERRPARIASSLHALCVVERPVKIKIGRETKELGSLDRSLGRRGREFEPRFQLQTLGLGTPASPGFAVFDVGLSGRVVMQRPAKPCTPVRFRP